MGAEGVVGGLSGGPGVVGAGLESVLLLEGLLLLLLVVEGVGLGAPRVEGGLLRLDVVLLLLSKLIEAWLRTGWIASAIAVLEAGLLGLEASRLRVCIVEISCTLRLLLVHEIAVPVDGSLLLISLIVPGRLRLSRLCRNVIKQR